MRTKLIVKLMIIVALMSSVACANRPKAGLVRLGAVDEFDSRAYDVLLIAQASINEAKTSYASGKLPTNSKLLINNAVGAYNATRQAWLLYRELKAQGKPVDQLALQTNLNGLAAAIAEIFKSAGRKP